MRKNLVITVTGPDRIGIVEEVTKEILNHGGNVEISRMARLGGIFSMLIMVSIPEDQYDQFDATAKGILSDSYSVTTCQTMSEVSDRYVGWIPYQIEVQGADHEGIIHQIAQCLVQHKINIETMDTDMVSAPVSGAHIFSMNATVLVPPDLSIQSFQNEMEELERELNVDIEAAPYTG